MLRTVELPDQILRESESVASSEGMTLDQLITRALRRELSSRERKAQTEIDLPIVHSRNPGTLDLADYDFDDLLA